MQDVVVMCTDRVEMRVKAGILFRIKDPLLTVGSGIDRIKTYLEQCADGSLRSILSQHSSTDISLALNHKEGEGDDTEERRAMLKEVHDSFVEELAKKASSWGLEIMDLQFTNILPADEKYHNNVREIGAKLSMAEANRTLAQNEAAILQIKTENEAKIAKTKAAAEESRVTAAEIEGREAKIRAETAANKLKMEAEAKAAAIELEARAEAGRIEMMGKAEASRARQIAEATNNVQGVGAELLRLDRQREMMASIKDPVYLPQPHLGNTIIWSQDGRRVFTTQNAQNSSQSGDVSSLVTQVATQMAAMGMLRDGSRRLPSGLGGS